MNEGKVQTHATVSVAMIAKNEAGTLQPALQSVRKVADEIVVLVDDASTDQTFEVAKQYADIVEWFRWSENFAKARNKSIERCSSDWILIMDGHEVLHPKSVPVLHNILQRVGPGKDLHDTDVFSAQIYMDPASYNDLEKMIPKSVFLQPRLFRNNGNHYYTGRVHNYLTEIVEYKSEVVKRPVNELVFVHKRTEASDSARKEQRAEMNVRILQEEVEAHPNDPRHKFYLAQTYYEVEDYDNALHWYEEYLAQSEWKSERAHAGLMLGSILAERQQFREARDVLMQALEDDWERAELYITLGDIAFKQKQLYEAEHWYKASQEMRPPLNGMFLQGAAYTWLPYTKIAALYSAVGEWFKAVENAKKAFELGYVDDTGDLTNKMAVWKEQLGLRDDRGSVVIYDRTGEFNFLQDIRQQLATFYNVATGVVYDPARSSWADVLWFEWCDNQVIEAAQLPKPPHQKWVVRLHGYEVFARFRLLSVDWSKIDMLIFVCDHVRRHFNSLVSLPDNVDVRVIENGVDVDRWSYAKRQHSKSTNIDVIGVLTEKKGPHLLAEVIKHFAKHHSQYNFRLRMDTLSSPDVNERMLNYELRDFNNWEWVPRVEDLDEWMEDTKFLLSTSMLESFSYVTAEAMCKGIKPLIHDWHGSREVWPEELIWRDIEELEATLESEYDSEMYRQWVEDRYSLPDQIESLHRALDPLVSQALQTKEALQGAGQPVVEEDDESVIDFVKGGNV